MHSGNSLVTTCIKRALHGSHSDVGNSIAFLRHNYGLDHDMFFSKHGALPLDTSDVNEIEDTIRDFVALSQDSNDTVDRDNIRTISSTYVQPDYV